MMCFSTNAGEAKAEGKFLEEEHQSKQDLLDLLPFGREHFVV